MKLTIRDKTSQELFASLVFDGKETKLTYSIPGLESFFDRQFKYGLHELMPDGNDSLEPRTTLSSEFEFLERLASYIKLTTSELECILEGK